MKRIMYLAIAIMLMSCFCSAAIAADYSFLDDMTLAELQELKTAVEGKITTLQMAGNADNTYTGIWTIRYYVDEFGDRTSEGYITNAKYFQGKFSNSATTKSELYVDFLIDKDDVAIELFEYGRSQVKNSSSKYSDTYNVTIKDGSGRKYSMKGTMYPGGDRIFFSSADESIILGALSAGGKVSFSIVDSERTINTYTFSIEDSAGFANAYQELTGKEL